MHTGHHDLATCTGIYAFKTVQASKIAVLACYLHAAIWHDAHVFRYYLSKRHNDIHHTHDPNSSVSAAWFKIT